MDTNYNGSNNYDNGNSYNNGNGFNDGSTFSTAAMVFGIIAVITGMIFPVYLPSVLGSLAILFALLSKGRAAKLSTKAVAGIACGTVGIAIHVAVFCLTAVMLLSEPDLMINTAQMYDDIIKQMYGMPSEDIFGESMEDTGSLPTEIKYPRQTMGRIYADSHLFRCQRE